METDDEKRKRIRAGWGVPSYDRRSHPRHWREDADDFDERERDYPKAANEQLIEWIRRMEHEFAKLRWPR